MQSIPQTQPADSGPTGPESDERTARGTGGAKAGTGRAYTADLVRVALFTGVVVALLIAVRVCGSSTVTGS